MTDIRSQAASLWEEGDRRYEGLFASLAASGPVAVFGAGDAGTVVANALRAHNLTVDRFSDNAEAKWGMQKEGVPVVAPEQLRDWKGTVIVASWAEADILKQLEALNVAHTDTELYVATLVQPQRATYRDHLAEIERFEGMLADEKSKDVLCSLALHALTLDRALLYAAYTPDQYFSESQFAVRPGDVVVDGGAFTGDTVHDIVLRFGKIFETIHCFEPNEKNIQELNKVIVQDGLEGKVQIHPQGLFSETGTIGYAGAGSSFHRAVAGESVTEQIPMITLDACLNGARVDLIKMDIEGGEQEALKGAEQTIRQWKPRLAICVYHEPHHLWELPFFAQRTVPTYRFFLRNHTTQRRETVMYALPA